MSKIKTRNVLIYFGIILSSIIIALITGNGPSNSINGFYSYILIGFWLVIGIIGFIKIKNYKEFNGTLNRGVFIISVLMVGFIYSIWGEYTTILQESILGENIGFILWHLIFGLPYLLFGEILLFLSYKKYFYVYFGNKPIKARLFCIITSITYIFFSFLYLLSQGDAVDFNILDIDRQNQSINLLIILNFIFLIVIVVLSFVSKKSSYSGLPIRRVRNQISSIDRQIDTVNNYTDNLERRDSNQRKRNEDARKRANDQAKRQYEKERKEREKRAKLDRQKRQKESESRNRRNKPTNKASNSSSKRSYTSSSSSRVVRSTSSSKSKKNSPSKAQQKKFLLNMRPKTGVLAEDDFKCIFCFELPKKNDKHGGIVLCPKCKYPAHYDEFRAWVRNSALCSRCDGQIPSSYRNNPKVISTDQYLKGFKFWKKKFK